MVFPDQKDLREREREHKKMKSALCKPLPSKILEYLFDEVVEVGDVIDGCENTIIINVLVDEGILILGIKLDRQSTIQHGESRKGMYLSQCRHFACVVNTLSTFTCTRTIIFLSNHQLCFNFIARHNFQTRSRTHESGSGLSTRR